MAKGKKKEPRLRVVAPEPAGDVWEAEIRWAQVDGAPVPSLLHKQQLQQEGQPPLPAPASEHLFPVTYDVEETNPLPLLRPTSVRTTTSSLAPPSAWSSPPRATDVFRAAEASLKAAKAEAAASQGTLKDFENLAVVELREAEGEKAQFSQELVAALTDLDEATDTVLDTMSRAAEMFFTEQKNILARIFDLAAHDHEIEAAFDERVATMAECERVMDCYYKEHGVHVNTMAEMRRATAENHAVTLEAMRSSLQSMVAELMGASMLPAATTASPTTTAATSGAVPRDQSTGGKERTVLRQELAKAALMNADVAFATDASSSAATSSLTSLQRLVELEEQRLVMAHSRNAALRRETSAFKTAVSVAPHSTAVAPEPFAVTQRQTPTEEKVDVDLSNALLEARRQLDAVTAELSVAREALQRASQHHLAQLSGRCAPSSLQAPDAIRTAVNRLDAETRAAVKTTVVEAMMEVDVALRSSNPVPSTYHQAAPAAGCTVGHSAEAAGAAVHGTVALPNDATAFARLLTMSSAQERSEVQNFVVRRINRLFTTRHPTAPPAVVPVD